MAQGPEIDIELPDNEDPEADKELDKSKFWHRLSVTQKKLAIIAGLIVAIGLIGKGAYDIGSWVKTAVDGYTENKHRIDSLATTSREHTVKISSFKQHMDSLVNYEVINRYHILIDDSIMCSMMKDVVIDSVHFRESKVGQLYYYKDGFLYEALKHKSGLYYYFGDDGKTHWCE